MKGPTRSARVAHAVAALSWIAAAGLSAWLAVRHEALGALASEVWILPLALISAHALLLLAVGVPIAALAREAPTARGVMLALPALGLLLAVWLPDLGAPVALPAASGPEKAGPHVVLITLDTFRADHLGALSGRDLTPNLDALANSGTLYTQAIATAPLTGPSHASMLTGLAVREHGLIRNGRAISVDTVVPEMAARGWRTGAFLSTHVLDRQTGLQGGFAHYDDAFAWSERVAWIPGAANLVRGGRAHRNGDETVDRALEWLASDDRPTFLWVHLYDAHMPYEPPAAWRPDADAIAEARAADQAERQGTTAAGRGMERAEGAHVREGKLLYAAEIRYVDHLVGRVLDALPPDTVVIVVADHGESHDEHGYWFNHGARLHEPALHVPMITRWPGQAPTVVPDLVSVQDVAGMLLAATSGAENGVPAARQEVVAWTSGQQNRRQTGGKKPGQRKPSAAIRLDRGKLVSQEGGRVVWHDLAADPGELAPGPVPEALSGAATRVDALVHDAIEAAGAEERARLEALGYVE